MYQLGKSSQSCRGGKLLTCNARNPTGALPLAGYYLGFAVNISFAGIPHTLPDGTPNPYYQKLTDPQNYSLNQLFFDFTCKLSCSITGSGAEWRM